MSLAWYVVQVATNMEDKVQTTIVNSILYKKNEYLVLNKADKLASLKNSFGITEDLLSDAQIEDFLRKQVVLVPKEKIEEIRNGKKREAERKISPGYLLIKMEYSDESGLLIKRTAKVAGFVGVAKDSSPVPITQAEVDNILQQVESSKGKAKHRVEFEVGEKIRITDGPFLDFNATIEEVLYSKTKLRVSVQIFGRDTAVELDFAQVEKTQ